MPPVVPPKRPEITRAEIIGLLAAARVTQIDKAFLAGVRGHYADMGKAGANDRGIYDDAIVLISPLAFVTFNANTDPSTHGKGKASLVPGLWPFEIGTHNRSKPKDKQYEALVQAGPFVVRRDDTAEWKKGERVSPYGECLGDGLWTNYPAVPSFGINIHRGGNYETISEGCQTIYKPQWDAFIALVKMEMERHGQQTIHYLLTEKAA